LAKEKTSFADNIYESNSRTNKYASIAEVEGQNTAFSKVRVTNISVEYILSL